LAVISGEADEAQTNELQREWKNRNVRFARNLPLPSLAGILQRATFIGHDSGISHLAAAAGANCILLFGPTDPDVWAPQNENVRVLRSPSRKLKDLEIATVEAALASLVFS
jgi:heptosyltransferase-2